MREAKPGLVLLYPANLAGAPGAFRGLHGVRGAKPGEFQGLHACAEQNPAGFRACTRARSKTRRVSGLARRVRGKTRRVSGLARMHGAKPDGFRSLHAVRVAKPGEFRGLHACAEQNPAGFRLARVRGAKPGEFWGLHGMRGVKPGGVLLYPANLAGAPGAFRGRQGRLLSFPGYLVVTSPGPAGPLRQKIRGAPFLLCVGKRRPEGCSASTSRRRDRATSYVEILLRCCYCPSAQNSFEAMR